jgi:hypothetical protein
MHFQIVGLHCRSITFKCYFHAYPLVLPYYDEATHAKLQTRHTALGDDAAARAKLDEALDHFEKAKYHSSMVGAHQERRKHETKQRSHQAAGELAESLGDTHSRRKEHKEASKKYKQSIGEYKLAHEHEAKARKLSRILEPRRY